MSRQTEASNRALHHEAKPKLKERRRVLEAERRQMLADEAARGFRSHAVYCHEEGVLPAEAHKRICEEARRRRG